MTKNELNIISNELFENIKDKLNKNYYSIIELLNMSKKIEKELNIGNELMLLEKITKYNDYLKLENDNTDQIVKYMVKIYKKSSKSEILNRIYMLIACKYGFYGSIELGDEKVNIIEDETCCQLISRYLELYGYLNYGINYHNDKLSKGDFKQLVLLGQHIRRDLEKYND